MKNYIFTTLSVAFAITLVGCTGSGSDSATSDSTPGASLIESFVPAADQFGIEQFKVVYALEGQETGTRTLWVEAYGDQVGVEDVVTIYGQKQHKLYYWDGEKGHMRTLPADQVSSMGLRMKTSEPTSFATTPAASLEMVGYARVGDKELVGKTCEHWKNEQFNYEGCRWQRIELEFHNGAGTDKIIQSQVATALVEGEGIPEHIRQLAASQ